MLMRFLNNGRSLGSSASVLMLALAALALWYVLPPEPRVVIEGKLSLNWLSPDGGTLCTLQHPNIEWIGPIRFWDTHTGMEISTFLTSADHKGVWPEIAPDGRRFVTWTDSGRLTFGDWQTGRSWTVPLPGPLETNNEILFSPDSEILAASQLNGHIALIETSSGRVLDLLSADAAGSPPWEFARNGNYLVYNFSDKENHKVRFWNTRTRQREAVRDIDGGFVAISPDGKTLVTAEQQAKSDADPINTMTLWDLDPPKNELRARNVTKANYLAFSFSDDSKTLATWDGGLQASIAEFWNVQTGQFIAATPEFNEFHGGALSPDGSHFALSSVLWTGPKGKRDSFSNLTLYDVANGTEVWNRTWNEYHGCRPQFNVNGNLLQVYIQGQVEFLDAATGRTVTIARFRKQPSGSNGWTTDSLVVTPDRRLLPYREEMQIARFEPTRLDRVLAFLGIPKRPDEETNWDMVIVIEMATGREIMHLEGIGTTNPAFLSDDGCTLVTQHADHIAVWDVPGRPALRWVLGVPLGLAAGSWCGFWLWRRVRRKAHQPGAPAMG